MWWYGGMVPSASLAGKDTKWESMDLQGGRPVVQEEPLVYPSARYKLIRNWGTTFAPPRRLLGGSLAWWRYQVLAQDPACLVAADRGEVCG